MDAVAGLCAVRKGKEPVGPFARMVQEMSRHRLWFVGTTSEDGQTPPKLFRSHVYYTSSQLMLAELV